MASFYGCKRVGGADGTIINPIMSARMRTAKSFSFKYGKVEAKAKVSTCYRSCFSLVINFKIIRCHLETGYGQPFGCFLQSMLMVSGQHLEK